MIALLLNGINVAAGQLLHGWSPRALGLSLLAVVAFFFINLMESRVESRVFSAVVTFLGFALLVLNFAMPWLA